MHVGTTVHAPNGSDSRILVRDTWNTDIVSELTPERADTVHLQEPLQRVL